MLSFDPHTLRDPAFKQAFEQKLAAIKEVRKQDTFLSYSLNQALFDELVGIYQENLNKYHSIYRKHQDRFSELQMRAKANPDLLSRVDSAYIHSELARIRPLVEHESYEQNARGGEQLQALNEYLQQALRNFKAWKAQLRAYRSGMKSLLFQVWAEDYRVLKKHYKQFKLVQALDQPLEMPEPFLSEAKARKASSISQLKKLAKAYPKYQQAVETLENSFVSSYDAKMLEKRIRESRLLKRAGRVVLALFAGGMLAIAGVKAPYWFRQAQEQQSWDQAQQQHSYRAYQRYVEAYPNGVFLLDAQQAILGLDSANTPTFLLPDGRTCAYAGQLQAGLPQGQGIARFPEGGYYEGEWDQGYYQGQGFLQNSTGETYRGAWLGGQRDGEGTQIYADSTRYTGNWKAGKASGQGQMEGADGSYYEGAWQENLFGGQGSYLDAEGHLFQGIWKAGKLNGWGSHQTPDSSLYEGFWQDGLRHGQGRQYYSDGTVYVGAWETGKKNGEGLIFWADGSSYAGNWEADQLSGKGTFRDRFRAVYEGVWAQEDSLVQFFDESGTLIKTGYITEGIFKAQD